MGTDELNIGGGGGGGGGGVTKPRHKGGRPLTHKNTTHKHTRENTLQLNIRLQVIHMNITIKNYSKLNLFTRVLFKKKRKKVRLLLVLFASLSLISPKQQLSTNQRLINQTNNSQTKLTFHPSFQLLEIRSSCRFSLFNRT